MTPHRPDAVEARDYYFKYIDKAPGGDIRDALEAQMHECLDLFEGISEAESMHKYAEDKWTIRGVLAHMNDTERVFVYRALWFGRGLDTELPSFEEAIAASTCAAEKRSWRSHVQEFRAVRAATTAFFRNLPDDAWMRRGVASGSPVTVNALAYIAAGHVAHHMDILRERYLTGRSG